uniref:L1 transposable element RRM domain-containing protein n=1 Tax=Cyprinus carpio TaxID=7962 RepID=A0A8C2H697_CYPCA
PLDQCPKSLQIEDEELKCTTFCRLIIPTTYLALLDCNHFQRKMPKGDKSITATKASNATEQASTSPGGTNKTSSDILGLIETLKSELKEDNDKLRKDINTLSQEMGNKLDNLTEEMRGLTERMEEAENCVGRVEDMTLDLTEAIQNKLTDLESRSRRNNIRLFRVGKGEEGKSVTQFVTDFLKRELPLPADFDLKIQRAHRVFAAKPRPKNNPRQIIVNFQEYTTKELILKEAWKKGRIQSNGRNIYFDHDYATEIVQKRMAYQEIKKVLKEKGVRFQTPYTSIRIHWESGVGTYSSAHEAGMELRKRGLEVEVPTAVTEEVAMETRLQKSLGWQREAQIKKE